MQEYEICRSIKYAGVSCISHLHARPDYTAHTHTHMSEHTRTHIHHSQEAVQLEASRGNQAGLKLDLDV